jgi:hypothetical protein
MQNSERPLADLVQVSNMHRRPPPWAMHQSVLPSEAFPQI